MNLMKLFFRSKELTSVDVAKTWEVRWQSRYGPWHDHTRPEVKIFTNYKDAKEFKDALEDAFKLTKYTCSIGTRVIIEKTRH